MAGIQEAEFYVHYVFSNGQQWGMAQKRMMHPAEAGDLELRPSVVEPNRNIMRVTEVIKNVLVTHVKSKRKRGKC